MRVFRFVGIVLLLVSAVALAKDNKFGVRDVSHVKFDTAVHIGTTVLPAGQYEIRHTMEGQEHVMVFKRQGGKDEYKVKCTLVPLEKHAPRNQAIYQMKAGNEKVLQELVFQGDSAKHVFGE